MSSNIQRLANSLAGQMQKTASTSVPVTVELGVINSDSSLTTDTLKGNISPNDYMIDLQLTHESYLSDKSDRVPSVFRRLQPGDRVLVMWAGNEPIVTAIVVSGDTTTSN